jgi:mono/diheme cytochrome c family protein
MKWLRRIGIALGILIAFILVAGATLYALGSSKFNKQYTVPEHALPAANDGSMARGEYLAATRGCTECHGANLGGQLFINSPPFAILPAPNLTRGRNGVGAQYTDRDWERAIRHGVNRERRTLLIMPSNHFTTMSDDDVRAVITYISAQPPVDSSYPARKIGPIARILVGAGQPLPLVAGLIDQRSPHRVLREEPTLAYGAMIGQSCKDCHGANLEGAEGERGAPALNARGNPAKWTEAQFINTLRTGTTPEGKQLDADRMPWRAFGKMNETELRALWMYLQSVQGRTSTSTGD